MSGTFGKEVSSPHQSDMSSLKNFEYCNVGVGGVNGIGGDEYYQKECCDKCDSVIRIERHFVTGITDEDEHELEFKLCDGTGFCPRCDIEKLLNLECKYCCDMVKHNMDIFCETCGTKCVEHHNFNEEVYDYNGDGDGHSNICEGCHLCPRCSYHKLEKINCGICIDTIEKYALPSALLPPIPTIFKCSCCHGELDHPDDFCWCSYKSGSSKK